MQIFLKIDRENLQILKNMTLISNKFPKMGSLLVVKFQKLDPYCLNIPVQTLT